MSVLAYTGLPGSGKSYDAVQSQILPALKAGRRVVTNIPLHVDRIKEAFPGIAGEVVEFPTEEVASKPERIEEFCTAGSVVVLDEVYKLFPLGQTAKQVPPVYRSILAEHRHRVDEKGDAMQIVLVCQDLAQIGPFARQLVEQTFIHTKLSAVGLSKAYRVDVYQGSVVNARASKGARVREIPGIYSKDVFQFYKSHTMSEFGREGANEASVDRRGVVWKRPIFWLLPVAFVLVLAFGVPTLMSFFRKDRKEAAPASGGSARTAPQAVPVKVSPSPATLPAHRAPRWRITGRIVFETHPEKDVVFLRDGDRLVTLPLRNYCQTTLEGWTVCEYEGVSVSSEVSYRPESKVDDRPTLLPASNAS